MQMEKEGHRCTSIQGDMEPEQRDRVVDEFRKGTTKILIATDVLSRGFDVTQVGSAHICILRAHLYNVPSGSWHGFSCSVKDDFGVMLVCD